MRRDACFNSGARPTIVDLSRPIEIYNRYYATWRVRALRSCSFHSRGQAKSSDFFFSFLPSPLSRSYWSFISAAVRRKVSHALASARITGDTGVCVRMGNSLPREKNGTIVEHVRVSITRASARYVSNCWRTNDKRGMADERVIFTQNSGFRKVLCKGGYCK